MDCSLILLGFSLLYVTHATCLHDDADKPLFLATNNKRRQQDPLIHWASGLRIVNESFDKLLFQSVSSSPLQLTRPMESVIARVSNTPSIPTNQPLPIYYRLEVKLMSGKKFNTHTVTDKHDSPIHVGDHVWTRARGDHREGDVTDIVTSDEEATEKGVKHPPKILFEDQHGHSVAHNPGTLEKRNE